MLKWQDHEGKTAMDYLQLLNASSRQAKGTLKANQRQAERKLKASEEPEMGECHGGTQAPRMPKGKLKERGNVTQGTGSRNLVTHPTGDRLPHVSAMKVYARTEGNNSEQEETYAHQGREITC